MMTKIKSYVRGKRGAKATAAARAREEAGAVQPSSMAPDALDAVPVLDEAAKVDAPMVGAGDLEARVLDLLACKEPQGAALALIAGLTQPKDAGLALADRVDSLAFLSRVVQQGMGSDYGPTRLREKLRWLTDLVQQLTLPEGGFLELGSGSGDALALAVCFYLNGMSPALATATAPCRSEAFLAQSLYDILAHIRMFPGRYAWRGERKPQEILARFRGFALGALEAGDYTAGLDSITEHVRQIADAPLAEAVAPGSISLLCSFGLLNRVADPAELLRQSFEVMATGGIACHRIDLADCSPSQIADAALSAGFELLENQRMGAAPGDGGTASPVPSNATHGANDAVFIQQNLVLRKPS